MMYWGKVRQKIRTDFLVVYNLRSCMSVTFMRFFVSLSFETGISYLSRAQESAAKVRIENPSPSTYIMNSSSTHTVADTVFLERIKSRVKHWKNACRSSKKDG